MLRRMFEPKTEEVAGGRSKLHTKVIQKVSTVCAYLSRILETVPLLMCSYFLYQLRSHRRHFVKFVLCLCLFLCVKHVWDNWRGRRLWNTVCNSFFESQECATKWDSSPDLSSVWWQCDEWWHETINFRFSPCILTFNHFYCPNNALNYIKLRD